MLRSNRWPRRADRPRRAGDDSGAAALEFILVGLLLLVPLVYLVVALGQIQGQALGVETGARHLARAVSTAPDAAAARDRVDRVVTAIVEEYGIDPSSVEVALACTPAGECPRAGSTLMVTLRTAVPLPLVPPVLGLERLVSVPVEATSVQRVSRFWGEP
ncbi:hypothetical protein GCM10022200_07730 [Microbacterium awajiense]|uniref:TadE family protein n=1 Tax=Microbacterium awajiense TaxID=415214 RepID=A0ABP7A9P9_9MICO